MFSIPSPIPIRPLIRGLLPLAAAFGLAACVAGPPLSAEAYGDVGDGSCWNCGVYTGGYYGSYYGGYPAYYGWGPAVGYPYYYGSYYNNNYYYVQPPNRWHDHDHHPPGGPPGNHPSGGMYGTQPHEIVNSPTAAIPAASCGEVRQVL